MAERKLPDHVYSAQYLKQSGVRFDYNIVDSTVKKGLGLGFYLVLALFVFVTVASSSQDFFKSYNALVYQKVLEGLCLAYLILVLGKYLYFLNLRKKLRKDPNPIIVEAYAVVILDEKKQFWWKLIPFIGEKSAIVYRECGTNKPRFFLGASYNRILPPFMQDQLARVFIDRKNFKLYSVDEVSALQPQSVKASRVLGMMSRAANNMQVKEGTSEV